MTRVIQCPFCDHEFECNCEFVDVGVGNQQVTPNYCPACGAFEQGVNHEPSPLHRDLYGWSKSNVTVAPHPTDPHAAIAIVIVDNINHEAESNTNEMMEKLGFSLYIRGMSEVTGMICNVYQQPVIAGQTIL